MAYNVYVFLDGNNRPYYVGKTNNMIRRRREHIEEILNGNNLPKYNKARQLMQNGIRFNMKKIKATDTETEAWRLERYYIKKFRNDGYKLFNCTSGGPYELPIRINNPKSMKKVGIAVNKPIKKKIIINKKKIVKKIRALTKKLRR